MCLCLARQLWEGPAESQGRYAYNLLEHCCALLSARQMIGPVVFPHKPTVRLLSYLLSHPSSLEPWQVIATAVTSAEGSQLKNQIEQLKLAIEKLLI